MQVIGQWVLRRAMELGGLGGAIFVFYDKLPPSVQVTIGRLFSGGWSSVTLGEVVDFWPIVVAIWGYTWSFISTVRPHATDNGVQVSKRSMPETKQEKLEEIVTAPRRKGLLEQLFGKRNV